LARRYFLRLGIFFSLVVILASGCGGKKVVKPSDESVKAAEALKVLNAMQASYEARDMAGVLKPLSQDFMGGYSEFQASVRKDIETYPKVSLDTTVERVELEGDLVKVVFHWFGKWTNKDGQAHEGRGNSIFVFNAAGSAMSLDNIIGDSPFGVVR
jgi:hypothetical protein